MFTAFDKVHHTQYGLYAEYAEMNPAVDEGSVQMAQAILGSTPKEDMARELTAALREEKNKSSKVAYEFDLFAIRSASGVEFDVYLIDEDSRLVSVETSVEDRLVRVTGIGMLEDFDHSIHYPHRNK